MNWIAYSSVIGLATFKFMFAPFAAIGQGLNFFEAVICSLIGAIISASIFYFSSDYFMGRAQKKRAEKEARSGQVQKMGKKKRAMNKLILKIKRSLGIYGICFFAPLFLSVPIGTIICAKFYRKQAQSIWLIYLGLIGNSLILTSLATWVF